VSERNPVILRLLGNTAMYRGGQPVSGAAARRHPLALLAVLAAAPNQSLSRPRAVGLLWPDAGESTGRNRLSSTIYTLRKALGPGALAATGDVLRLDRDHFDCDLWRFQEALDSGDREAAVRAYGGVFLDGHYLADSSLFEEWAAQQRRSLHRHWREAVRALARAAEDADRPGSAAHHWETLAADDPLDTDLATRLLRSLAAAGRRREALNYAEQHIARLDAELDAKPDGVFLEILKRLRSNPDGAGGTPEGSIAVLIFDAPDEDSQSLAEGVHNGILNRLATVDGLTVIARTSVQRYRGSNRDAAEIGAELGVRWVLEGSVLVRGEQFRIDVRLVRARENRPVWAYDFVGQLGAADYFGLQANIVEELFERLRHQVTPDERIRLARVPTENFEAHRRAAEARVLLDQRTPEAMQLALERFEAAIDLDPLYAVAWIGIADTLGLMYAYGYSGQDVIPRAQEAIGEALKADKHCAEAHAALGRMYGQLRRVTDAKEALRRAVDLMPGYAEAHNWSTVGYHVTGDTEAAYDSSRRAVALNPMSAEALSNFSSSLLYMGRPGEALTETQRVLELEPAYDTALFFAAIAHYELEQFEEAIESLAGVELPWAGAGAQTVRALAHAALGQTDAAREWLEQIRETPYAFDEGLALAALGDTDGAIEAFSRARFDDIEMALGYWPTVCVRYLFKRVWQAFDDPSVYDQMLQRIEESWVR
jgi:DNA-binding SARP family transcriptional activator/Tfp pilus assembly protein PilF